MTAGHERPTAVIAEDEPVLARMLTRLLGQAWPELRIAGVAEDGLQATELALAGKRPGKSG
jgi:DNA-binding LytR/AlgR family response regulator